MSRTILLNLLLYFAVYSNSVLSQDRLCIDFGLGATECLSAEEPLTALTRLKPEWQRNVESGDTVSIEDFSSGVESLAAASLATCVYPRDTIPATLDMVGPKSGTFELGDSADAAGLRRLIVGGESVPDGIARLSLNATLRVAENKLSDFNQQDQWTFISIFDDSGSAVTSGYYAVVRRPGNNEYNIGAPGFVPGYTLCGPDSSPESVGLRLTKIGMSDREMWSGSCAPAYEYSVERLQDQLQSIVARTVLITGDGYGIATLDNGTVVASIDEEFCDQGRWSRVFHCSGYLLEDRLTVVTALHCLPRFGSTDISNLEVGGIIDCGRDDKLRVVVSEALEPKGASNVLELDDNHFSRCKSITRIGSDIVSISLDSALDAPLMVGSFEVDGIEEVPTSVSLISGVPLFSSGFPQIKRVQSSNGGRLVPVRGCLDTLRFKLGDDDLQISSEILSYQGFGCVTVDTMNGMSGGPVFALHNNYDAVSLIGIHVSSFETGGELECRALTEEIVSDSCDAKTTRYNLIEFIP